MQEQLISFETAILAKQKGFNLMVQFAYDLKGEITTATNLKYFAPTQPFLQKWLRDVKGIEITIIPNYIYIVFPLKRMTDALDKLEKDQTIDLLDLASETEYKTYEEALEVALVEALKLI